MTHRFRVLPYSPYSNSARLLAEALGGKRIKLHNSRYVYREGDVVINWGNRSGLIRLCTINKDVNNLTTAANKLDFLRTITINLGCLNSGLTPRRFPTMLSRLFAALSSMDIAETALCLVTAGTIWFLANSM